MKKFLETSICFAFLLLIGTAIYQFRSPLLEQITPAINNIENNIDYFLPKPAPCSVPVSYTLGTFSPQFGISEDYFLSAVAEAQGIWEKGLGRKLFVYVPSVPGGNVLKINLVYDYRQQATDELAKINLSTEGDKASYNSLKTKYLTLQQQIAVAKSAYATSPSEALRGEINQMVTQINSVAGSLNSLAKTLNLSVTKYNSVNSSLSESFEEGTYVSDGGNTYIDIYEFSNRQKLVRVLAHELGHALGLEHVADPQAIMYALNQSDSLTLTADDINELKTKCRIK